MGNRVSEGPEQGPQGEAGGARGGGKWGPNKGPRGRQIGAKLVNFGVTRCADFDFGKEGKALFAFLNVFAFFDNFYSKTMILLKKC